MKKFKNGTVAAEQRLVLDYNKAKIRFEKLSKQVDDHFMPKLISALKENNVKLAQEILG